MLSPKLLETLRDWWRIARPKHWLFLGDIPGQHISKDAVEQACQKARQLCGIRKPITPHSLRHYVGFPTMSRSVAGTALVGLLRLFEVDIVQRSPFCGN
jgi:integrase